MRKKVGALYIYSSTFVMEGWENLNDYADSYVGVGKKERGSKENCGQNKISTTSQNCGCQQYFFVLSHSLNTTVFPKFLSKGPPMFCFKTLNPRGPLRPSGPQPK